MIKSITSVKVTGRRVIVRAGFDVPLKQGTGYRGQGTVMDDNRIKDCLPTLKYLIEQKAKIVIISHLGRPAGWQKDKSLLPVARKLAELLNFKFVEITDRLPQYPVPHVYFLEADITKHDQSAWSQKIPVGQILFLENMRFYPGEEANAESFVEILASFGDVYVNEAFSVAHRKEASTVSLAAKLPAYAGVKFLEEIQAFRRLTHNPAQPFVLMMGGAKIDEKEPVINFLAKHTAEILTGGILANTFLQAAGYEVGRSKVSDVNLAKSLLRHYKDKIKLPVDVIIADKIDGQTRCAKINEIQPHETIYDIGPETVMKFSAIIKQAKTLVWNGPMGMFENPKFAFGSKALAQAFAAQSKGSAYGVVGGGETVEVFDLAKVSQFVDHVSAGGGAMLEFLAGKSLPAIKALEGK